MMHNNLWSKSINAIEFCQTNEIRYIAKPFDNGELSLSYTTEQFDYLKQFWISTTNQKNVESSTKRLVDVGNTEKVVSSCEGRACCGGRKLSLNNDLKSSVTFVPKQGFKNWYCSVNWFFLFVRQTDGAVFVNRDCKMDFSGNIAPIGNLSKSEDILSTLSSQLTTNSMPIIRCAKSSCLCGYCAPKAKELDDFKDLIKRNVITDVIKYE